MRLIVEKLLNACPDDQALVAKADVIRQVIAEIRETVLAYARLERQSGEVLDKPALLQLAGIFVEIIARHIPDADLCARIGQEFAQAIGQANGGRRTEAEV